MRKSSISPLDRNIASKLSLNECISSVPSVIRALIENSIDAGASIIQIELLDFGYSSIRVTDNGVGINKQDLNKVCKLFHTSKLTTITEDSSYTYGFQGCSLANISYVIPVEIASLGYEAVYYKYELDGEIKESNVKDGTRVIIKNIIGIYDGVYYDNSQIKEILHKILMLYNMLHKNISFKLQFFGDDNIEVPRCDRYLDPLRKILNEKSSFSTYIGTVPFNYKDINDADCLLITSNHSLNTKGFYSFIFMNGRRIFCENINSLIIEEIDDDDFNLNRTVFIFLYSKDFMLDKFKINSKPFIVFFKELAPSFASIIRQQVESRSFDNSRVNDESFRLDKFICCSNIEFTKVTDAEIKESLKPTSYLETIPQIKSKHVERTVDLVKRAASINSIVEQNPTKNGPKIMKVGPKKITARIIN